MTLLLLLAALAFADDVLPVCTSELTAPGEGLSVAWVSPLRDQVGRNGWIEVVRTSDLRAALPAGGGVGRMLQLLGLRKRGDEPSRRWKVTIFDVSGTDLCRPLAGHEDPSAVEGAVTCPPSQSKVTRTYEGCGWTQDLATGKDGLETFSVRWDDAARNGFCVLPAERFVSPP